MKVGDSMLRYTAIRVVWIFIMIFTILSMNYIILKSAPQFAPTTEDDKELYFARQVSEGNFTDEVIRDQELIDQYLNDEIEIHQDGWIKDEGSQIRIYEPVPVMVQYVRWLEGIFTEWHWGYSTRVAANTEVFEVLSTRIPVTLRLNLIALVFYIPIGFALGIWAALKKNGLADNVISFSVMVMISIPSFVTMLLLVLVFGYTLEWLPKQFPQANTIGIRNITGLVLPVLGLSFTSIAALTRTTRAELTEVLTSEFLLLARTKGLTRTQSVIRHAMRNSMVPLVPGIIASFVGLLSGSVIIELIYGIPGTGRIYIDALERNNYDYNLIIGITAFYTIIGLFAVLLVDLSYGVVDPRIRMGAKK